MFGNLFGDRELDAAKSRYEGKWIVEKLKAKEKRHEIVWVGRAHWEDDYTGRQHIRIGIKWEGGDSVGWSNIEDMHRWFDGEFTIEG